jgi:hypothetical protein
MHMPTIDGIITISWPHSLEGLDVSDPTASPAAEADRALSDHPHPIR